MNNEALKKCPFCGGEGGLSRTISYSYNRYYVFIKCKICGAQGKGYTAKEDPAEHDWNIEECQAAADAWNMRTP